MQLIKKDDFTSIQDYQRLDVVMSWTSSIDFDLAAVYEKNNGDQDMVYFGKMGSLTDSPLMSLSGDAGVGDSGGDNEEVLTILKNPDIKMIHILCWDYGRVQDGSQGRFDNSDLKLSINNNGTSYNLPLQTTDMGNISILAKIQGGQLSNVSYTGTMKGFSKLQGIQDIIKQANTSTHATTRTVIQTHNGHGDNIAGDVVHSATTDTVDIPLSFD